MKNDCFIAKNKDIRSITLINEFSSLNITSLFS
jgi:hypothetical protein